MDERLQQVRDAIDAIDLQLVERLNERAVSMVPSVSPW